VEPVQRGDPNEGAAALATPSGAEVVVAGDTVIKTHRRGTDPQALARRLRVAARCPELLSPCDIEPEQVGDRWRTRWPRVDVVAAEPRDLPWREAGELLARLHCEPVDDVTLPHGAPDRLRRAVDRLGTGPRADVIRAAAAQLRLPVVGRETLVHGDFHLGQLGRHDGRWVLIDLDDLGVGDPAWDLARPAGFWAAGLVPDDDWRAFLDGYRAADGPALPAGDPWPALEPFARAAVIAAAANHPDDDLLFDACVRMAEPEN
jgi:aminoglycoside phosphotransferase (APT) family kinase protein